MTTNIDDAKALENLPTDVKSKKDLALLPDKFLSDDPLRPLYLHPYKYALNPLFYSVLFILIIECLERFTYYGISTTETAFLIGSYDESWNPNMTDVRAAIYTSSSIGIAYTAPFVGGILADGLLGDYWCIILGVAALYIPGLILISLTTFPGLVRTKNQSSRGCRPRKPISNHSTRSSLIFRETVGLDFQSAGIDGGTSDIDARWHRIHQACRERLWSQAISQVRECCTAMLSTVFSWPH
jgi:hypothetical protein